jgi:hypothetical protein
MKPKLGNTQVVFGRFLNNREDTFKKKRWKICFSVLTFGPANLNISSWIWKEKLFLYNELYYPLFFILRFWQIKKLMCDFVSNKIICVWFLRNEKDWLVIWGDISRKISWLCKIDIFHVALFKKLIWKCTVRAGNLGQISTLTLDCGAIGFLSALLQRGNWLILIWTSFSSHIVGTYFGITLLFNAKNLKILGFRFCG